MYGCPIGGHDLIAGALLRCSSVVHWQFGSDYIMNYIKNKIIRIFISCFSLSGWDVQVASLASISLLVREHSQANVVSNFSRSLQPSTPSSFQQQYQNRSQGKRGRYFHLTRSLVYAHPIVQSVNSSGVSLSFFAFFNECDCSNAHAHPQA